MRSSFVAALLIVAAASRAVAQPPAAVTRQRVEESGWQWAEGAVATRTLDLDVPALPVLDAVRVLQFSPDSFPRPAAVLGSRPIALPLTPRIEFMRRVEGPPPTLTWDVGASLDDVGAGIVALDADLPPRKDAGESGGPSSARARHQAKVGAPAERPFDLSVRPTAGWRQDPARRSGPTPEQVALDDRVAPSIVATPTSAIEDDGFFVSLDGGLSWLRLALAGPTRQVRLHALDSASLHGGQAGGRPVVFVTPRPTQARARLDVARVDASGSVMPLGSPALQGASWDQEVTDARLLPDGTVEVVVVVRDPLPRSSEPADSWGAVVRLDASGRWREGTRFALPGDDPAFVVAFGEGGLTLSRESVIGHLPLAP